MDTLISLLKKRRERNARKRTRETVKLYYSLLEVPDYSWVSGEVRVVVTGAGDTGKSALTVRFTGGNFVEKYDPTIEDSYRKMVEVDGIGVMMDLMDTAGQEDYRALRDQYMKTGNGFVIVYSITSKCSFETASKLRQDILKIKEDYPDTPMMLVGNYCDRESEREVSMEEGMALAAKYGIGFMEASPRSNHNVTEIFHELCRMIFRWRIKHRFGIPIAITSTRTLKA